MRRKGAAVLAGLFALVLLGVACGSGQRLATGAGGASAVRVGSVARPFTLPSAGGGSVSLAEFRGRKAVLLYFSMGPG
ncbi:MAG TPA: hypothetical protein VEQ37_12385 [Actinomycetota bacterium]|nr:hypothetical protein [Actinomycetota bacterium]